MPDSSAPFARRTGVLLLIVIACLWFANLDHRVLQHPDEGRYSEIAREMTHTGDWITPRLNGLKYFEKPPLQYWLSAATFEAFGLHEWTARLVPALAGFLGVVVIGYAGWKLGGPRLGVSAGLALAGTLWQIALAQIVTLDALLSFLLTVGFAGFVVGQRAQATPTARRNALWITWAAMAGATLTKGLIGIVLPGGALVIYTLVTRDSGLWRRLHLGSGLALYLVLSAPWFILVSTANPGFMSFFFVHEHFQRFLTTEHHRQGAWWYFIPLFVAGAIPWLVILVVGAGRAWREGAPNALGFSWQRFALVWAAFIFVFFSASDSKLPSYILPIFPPLALVAGWLLLDYAPAQLARITLPLTIAAVILAIVGMLAYPALAARFADAHQPMSTLLAFGPWMKGALVAAAAGGVLAIACFRRGTERGRFLGITALALSTLAATQLIVGGLDSFRSTRSSYDILRQAGATLGTPTGLADPRIPFYQVGMYDQTVPFYLRRLTTLVAFRDELALGIDAQPQLAIKDTADWIPVWDRLSMGYAILAPDEFASLERDGVPMRVLARDTRRVIVSRR